MTNQSSVIEAFREKVEQRRIEKQIKPGPYYCLYDEREEILAKRHDYHTQAFETAKGIFKGSKVNYEIGKGSYAENGDEDTSVNSSRMSQEVVLSNGTTVAVRENFHNPQKLTYSIMVKTGEDEFEHSLFTEYAHLPQPLLAPAEWDATQGIDFKDENVYREGFNEDAEEEVVDIVNEIAKNITPVTASR